MVGWRLGWSLRHSEIFRDYETVYSINIEVRYIETEIPGSSPLAYYPESTRVPIPIAAAPESMNGDGVTVGNEIIK